jgi:4-amino-4-deoxy-L-arabinose transferase-like glycosyltransferase
MVEKYLKRFLLAGILIRIVSFAFYNPEHGAILQAAMAKGFMKTGFLTMQYGDIFDNSLKSALSHHFPPLYPLIIAIAAGDPYFDLRILPVVSIVLFLLTTIAVFYVTRVLHGRTCALYVSFLYLFNAAMMDNSAKCLAENLQILLIVLFILFFYLSSKKAYLYIPSGITLGLAYLSKSTLSFWGSMALVLIGVICLSLKNRRDKIWIIPGFLVFFSTVFPWGYRNYIHFGSFDTSAYINSMIGFNHGSALEYIKAFLMNFASMASIIIIPLIMFPGELRKVKRSDPFDFLLTLFAFLPPLMGVIYSMFFQVAEGTFEYSNTIRYGIIAFIPMMWLLMRGLDFSDKSTGRKAVALLVIFILSSLFLIGGAAITKNKPLVNEADLALAGFLRNVDLGTSGDRVHIQFEQSINKNDFYYYLFELENKYRDKKLIELTYAHVETDVFKSRLVPDDDTAAYISGRGIQKMPADFQLIWYVTPAGQLRKTKSVEPVRQLWLREEVSPDHQK